MKFKALSMAAIFFMTNFNRYRYMALLAPHPGSAPGDVMRMSSRERSVAPWVGGA